MAPDTFFCYAILRGPRVTGLLVARAVCCAALSGLLSILAGCVSHPLMTAAIEGNTKEVQRQLDQGVSPNFRHEHFFHVTALQWAARGGKTEVVQLLLDRGAEVNAVNDQGGTALQIASWHGYPEIVRLLLARGADINHQSNTGWTALHAAARQGREEVVRLLLQQGADPDAVTQDGQTAAIVATNQGYAAVAALMLAPRSGSEPARAPMKTPIVPPPIY